MEEEEEEEEFELDLEDQEEDEYQSEEGDKTEEEEEEETEEEEEEMQMEEDMEEEVEGMEKTEEEEEEEEEFKLDIEDQEEDVYQSEEGDETAEEVEEDKETEEEDDNGQEGAGVVAGHGASAARSKSLLRDVVHCHAQPRHYTYRVLVDPKTGCVMVRRRCLWPSRPAADGVPPQGQENLGEAGEVWRSEYQAEGTPPCEPREPAEGAASQKAEEPAAAAAEAEFWAGDVLADTSESSEAGACGPDDGAEADPPEGRELDSPADFKSGNVVHHLVMPKSVSFDTKEESEHQYENADEEKEDGNEKPEEGPKLDMVSAEGSSGEYSWKA
ncbi:histone acetyltransferase KAT6B-like [Orcinus orca]|uniref:histone acetyltransferase KAT6B-like n=1 Tax=Orcinus orca TaxID=9733 RepID=UPI002112963B|nr:histone acetyltransferase KAT6B-like [Orcinus orca]